MAFIQPLDLQTILISVFAGSVEIFIFLAFIFISGLAASFKMNGQHVLLMFALFGMFMAQFLGGIYALIVLIGGLFAFFSISRLVK